MSRGVAADVFSAPGMGLLLAGATSRALSLLAPSVGMLVLDRISLRTKLREIDDLYRLVGVRDQELMLPFADRMSGPVQRTLTKLGRRFSPSGYADGIRILMLRAGRLEPSAADRFMATCVLGFIAAPLFAFVAYSVTSSMGSMKFMSAGLCVAACLILPSSKLNRQVEDREKRVRQQLPDILDLL